MPEGISSELMLYNKLPLTSAISNAICFFFIVQNCRALWIFVFGAMFFIAACSYCGLLIYATYHDCDPLTTKLAKAKDQLLPLLVMRIFGSYPGLPGLFVAGVFSAALR